MIYVVYADLKEPNTGTFTAEAKTKHDAIEKARGLRAQGLRVHIIGPDGKRIDEADDD
jgi:hypothetical protein